MTPRELVSAHKYAEAAAECERLLKRSPDDLALIGWHATAMLCIGKLPEALEEHRRIDSREATELEGSHPELLTIGAILWLLGRQDEAIRTFESAVEGIRNDSIKYGDLAGGVSQGLLLWYAGITSGKVAAQELSLEYLRELAKKPRIKYWPGPLALFVLGTASRDEVLVQACGSPDPEVAMRLARKDVLKRRQLVNAMFYFATRSREQGLEEDCLGQMRTCAGIENPIIEVEWYLARGESERADAKT